jgi:hypothetical protein
MSAFEKAVALVKQGIAIYNDLTPAQRTSFLAFGLDVFERERQIADEQKARRKHRYEGYKQRVADIVNDGAAPDDDELQAYFDSLEKAQAEEAAEQEYAEGIGY